MSMRGHWTTQDQLVMILARNHGTLLEALKEAKRYFVLQVLGFIKMAMPDFEPDNPLDQNDELMHDLMGTETGRAVAMEAIRLAQAALTLIEADQTEDVRERAMLKILTVYKDCYERQRLFFE